MTTDPPVGWKLVPVEPTETMIRAFDVILPDHWTVRARHAWACALAAAPEPPAAPPDAMRERVRVLEGMLGSLRGYAASVWYDEAVASDEERDLMRRALAMLEPHHG